MRQWLVQIGWWMAVALALAACALPSTTSAPAAISAPRHTNITVPQLAGMLAQKDFLLVNTHVPFEGNIPGTDLAVPYDRVERHLDKLPNKKAKIVLYCRSGSMSRTAAERLTALGYTNLYNLEQGFVDWRAAGHPLTQDGPRPE